MCGRYRPPRGEQLKLAFGDWQEIRIPPDATWVADDARPTNAVPIVVAEGAERVLRVARWGLIPSWWSKPKPPPSSFNARGEEAAGKPMWRGAWKSRRCIVPAACFYEWPVVDGHKQQTSIARADGRLLAFAGLYETHAEQLTCTIVTCGPSAWMAAVHDRQPVILERDEWAAWLTGDAAAAQALVRPTDVALVAAAVGELPKQRTLGLG